MSGKYCKVKTIDDYPVSVPQIRQLRRNVAWHRGCRTSDIGTWGRLATDGSTAIAGTVTTIYLTAVQIDLSFFDQVYFGITVDGSGTATWTIDVSMTDGANDDLSFSLTNPGAPQSYVTSCTPGFGTPRMCYPRITVTRTSGAGTISFKYFGAWGHRATAPTFGPQNLRTALAADLVSALQEAKSALYLEQPLLGWFGSYEIQSSKATALRWFQLGDKLDDDETLASAMDARCVVLETVANTGHTMTLIHTQSAGAGSTVPPLATNNAGPYHEIDLIDYAQSYDVASPYSAGILEASATAGSNRPTLQSVMIIRTPGAALWSAIEPTTPPRQDYQIRTVEDTGAVGINDIAETIHKATWYQGGNVSGGMANGKAFTISTTLVTVFDGLIWVHNDAQSGSTWGSNTYQVALRLNNGGATVDMQCQLTIDGNATLTNAKAVATGDQYVVFDVAITGIDVTDYAVACEVELVNSASRSITLYSVQISRRGVAY
jgi:hypothetical protein